MRNVVFPRVARLQFAQMLERAGDVVFDRVGFPFVRQMVGFPLATRL